MVDPGAFAPFDFAQSYGRGLQVREMQEQSQNKRRLADLLPRAVHGDQAAIDQMAAVSPEMFLKLDARQREQAHAELEDVTGAVRWAMSDPQQKAQRWNQVVDFYSQHVPQVARYRDHPEMAESALMQLGQIGNYLKGDGSPTNLEREYNFLHDKDPALGDQYLHNKADGSPLVANNGDGTFTIIPRGYAGQGGGAPSGAPQPGQVVDGYRFKGGDPHDQHSWEAVGGPSPGGSATFP